jgi:hypothetical protein
MASLLRKGDGREQTSWLTSVCCLCLFCWLVDERVESEVKVRQRQTKKLFCELSQVSLSNPLLDEARSFWSEVY